jgi:UDP-N-acetylglucosamine--N-acetylmuramyl-(pentapeptide) pyrophosphoryl-undecaprenol N-acetylglucosamine transferase
LFRQPLKIKESSKLKTILLTGGGTAGHVTANIALLPALAKAGYSVVYAGSENGVERSLIEPLGIPYRFVRTGKLRRYLSLKNVTDAKNVLMGLFDAKKLIRQIKPDVVFSKGGFVSVPIVAAAGLSGVPVVLHESDVTPGLANKLCAPFAKKICCSFPETASRFPRKKAVYTQTPIRESLFSGSAKAGRAILSLSKGGSGGETSARPVLLVIGGSSGARAINAAVRAALPKLTETFFVAHICGKGNVRTESSHPFYRQFEYVNAELPDLFAAASLVVSRAGANTVFELLALKKPNLLIPLSRRASRGDQIQNAESFRAKGYSATLPEENLTAETLTEAVLTLFSSRRRYIDAMSKSGRNNGIASVMSVISEFGRP